MGNIVVVQEFAVVVPAAAVALSLAVVELTVVVEFQELKAVVVPQVVDIAVVQVFAAAVLAAAVALPLAAVELSVVVDIAVVQESVVDIAVELQGLVVQQDFGSLVAAAAAVVGQHPFLLFLSTDAKTLSNYLIIKSNSVP